MSTSKKTKETSKVETPVTNTPQPVMYDLRLSEKDIINIMGSLSQVKWEIANPIIVAIKKQVEIQAASNIEKK